MRQRERINVNVDQDTKYQISTIEGVAGCGDATDGTNNLLVFLVKDTPEVREAVMQVIGDKLPADRVTFEETGSFCTTM